MRFKSKQHQIKILKMFRSKKLPLFLALLIINLIVCGGQFIPSSSSLSSFYSLRSLSPYNGKTFASNLSEFASTIYQKSAAESSGNIVVSPLSVDTVLALLSLGAKKSTYTALENGLLLGNNAKSFIGNEFQTILQPMQNNPQISMANGIFVEQSYQVRPQFSSMARKQFYANVTNINFKDEQSAANILNNWASDETHGKITNLFNSQSVKGNSMILVNAIYFNGKWEVPFYKSNTQKQNFNYDNCNSTKSIPMMHNTHQYNYGNISSLNAEVVELPYKNSTSSMFIFLPWDCNGLSELETTLTKYDLSTLKKRMNGGSDKIVLTLPTFSIHSTIKLNPILKSMGMKKIFDPAKANFEAMLLPRNISSSSEVNLYVSKVLQKAMIDVDESGSVAAAVTYVRVHRRPPMPSPPTPQPRTVYFTANRPFMYMIRSNGHPLFMGRFVN